MRIDRGVQGAYGPGGLDQPGRGACWRGRAVARGPPQELALVGDKEQKLRGMLREIRDHMTKNSEDVGDRFAEVARKMHSEEIEHRTVHGRATAEEARALAEEGVPVQPLPVFQTR